VALLIGVSGRASALSKRVEVVQQGDFILIGNTLAHDCGVMGSVVVGTPTCPASGILDSAPDIHWQVESGSANASSMITPDMAKTAAVLAIPEGAKVTHAYLHWAAKTLVGDPADMKVTLTCLTGGAPTEVNADKQLQSSSFYHSSSDVTSYLQSNGSCTYLVSGVSSAAFTGANEDEGFAVWWMVVLYEHPKEPHRQLVVYDGLDSMVNGAEAVVPASNVLVPNGFAKLSAAKVGVVGYDGDYGITGDQFIFINSQSKIETPLKDMSGDANDFFNSTRSYLAAAVSPPGDLPQLKGTPGTMIHLDMDVVDITNLLPAGAAQFELKALSVEPAHLGGVITSIPAFTDEDKDGLSDDEETLAGVHPLDTDTDNDGVIDGKEGCSDVNACPNPAWSEDTDGDGLINALDVDSDNDGLYDGTELGLDCNLPGTDKWLNHCLPDADEGKTRTDPLSSDTDSGGVIDGSEDLNRDGSIGPGESNPTASHGEDDSSNIDSDGDGLSDPLEERIGLSKSDADSDEDGVLDGFEANFADDGDRDGLLNGLDADSDNDALLDGTEVGTQCDDPATDVSKGHCRADADPSARTSMVAADTDRGGVIDGSEDANLDGAIAPGELDPTEGHGTDDDAAQDADHDSLSDALEIAIGSNPDDADSDDDGAPDGKEANPTNDEDGDGKINVLDEDSDQDGLFDGTERGYGCDGIDTDKAQNHCIPDGDDGKEKTSMVNADTDGGGVLDGAEDFDKDGRYEPSKGEGNPLNPGDDVDLLFCSQDHPSCGPENSGRVCDMVTTLCVDGCRDVDGSRCPGDQLCVFPDPADPIGYCAPGEDRIPPEDKTITTGCICGVPSGNDGRDFGWAVAAFAGVATWWRRRVRRFE
jgi:hypothetical protein